MKIKILLVNLLCILAGSGHPQIQQCKAIFPSGPEQVGTWSNQPKYKPDHMVVPVKRNMFNPSNTIWKWDTIMCYNAASGSNPFQRVTRTYNSFGEQLTLFYERRQGSLAWENYAREADTYDSAGNYIGQLQEIWQNNAWVNFQKQEFAYNANGDQVDWKRMMWDSIAWDNMWHYTWHFDANGLNDTCVFQQGQDSLWINHWLWIPTYDANGYLASSLTYTWLNNTWQVTDRDTTTFDSYGNPLTLLRQDFINSSWVNNSFYTYTHDTSGNLLSMVYQEWQNNTWENFISNYYTYDPGGNLIIKLGQLWLNGAWTNSGRTIYVYDTANNMLSQTSQTWDNSLWRNQDTEQYTYDSSGNSLTGKYLHWYNGWQPYDGGLAVYADHEQDLVLGEVYRYEALVDSILVFTEPARPSEKITLFPNPAHSMVYVSLPSKSSGPYGSLTVYDLHGRFVLSAEADSETTGLDIRSLKPGVYFVRVSNDLVTRVVKFIKD